MKRILCSLLACLLTMALTILPAGAASTTSSSTAQGVVREDNTLWMWGSNAYSQIGKGAGSTTPAKIMEDVAKVVVNDGTTMVVKADGSLWGWGYCESGLFARPYQEIFTHTSGNSEYTRYYTENPIYIMKDVADVVVGSDMAAVLRTDGSLWMLGDVGWIKGLTDTDAPQKLFDNAKSADIYGDFLAVIKKDGSLWLCRNTWWKNGTIGWQDSFEKWMDNVSQVAIGYFCSAAVKTDGSLWTWDTPTRVDEGSSPIQRMTGVVQVSVDSDSIGFLKKDGTLWAFGGNKNFNLGTGDNVDRNSPVQIMSNVADFDIGSAASIAKQKDGSVWCWGLSEQLGVNNAYDNWSVASKYIPSQACQSVPLMAMGADRKSSEFVESTQVTAPSAWAKDDVEAARAAGLIPELTGTPNYSDTITREQFAELAVQMVTVLYGEGPDISNATTFTDCDNPKVITAAAAGIVSGVGNNKFDPKTTTNREQIAVMVARAIAYLEDGAGVNLIPDAADVSKFSDKGTVSAWAVDGVGTLAANGIMSGTSATTLSPKNPCTVEQSILLLYRVYEKFQAAT